MEWTFWHEEKQQSRHQARHDAEGWEDVPTVVDELLRLDTKLIRNHDPSQTWNTESKQLSQKNPQDKLKHTLTLYQQSECTEGGEGNQCYIVPSKIYDKDAVYFLHGVILDVCYQLVHKEQTWFFIENSKETIVTSKILLHLNT